MIQARIRKAEEIKASMDLSKVSVFLSNYFFLKHIIYKILLWTDTISCILEDPCLLAQKPLSGFLDIQLRAPNNFLSLLQHSCSYSDKHSHLH